MHGLIKDLDGLSQYIITTYKPIVGSSYIDLPIELCSPRKGLTLKIMIRNVFMVSC